MHSALKPICLRVEYLSDPLGIDANPPRFSWNLEGMGKQTAYRIAAASSELLIKNDVPDLWDTGKQDNSEQTFIPYAGKALHSGQRVFWRIQVWDEKNRVAESASAWFEMGLLHPEDWEGVFVAPPFCGAGGRGYHSAVFPAESSPELWVQVDLLREQEFDRVIVHPCYYREQGEEIGPGFGFPVRFQIETGSGPEMNNRRLVYETPEDIPNPKLKPYEIRFPQPAKGRIVRLTVIKPWVTAPQKGVALLALDEFEIYSQQANIARGKPVSCSNFLVPPVCAGGYDWHVDCLTDGVIQVDIPRHDQGLGNLCRQQFVIQKPVVRARAYIASRGWYDLRVNGIKADDAVLDSPWTVFEKRLLYSAWDVTHLLGPGTNVVTVLMGNGWTLTPAFILQLNAEHPDGSKTALFSDEHWRLLPSPIRENNVYHGETSDGRMDRRDVYSPSFNDSSYPFVPVQQNYRPALSAQMNPPIRVTDTIRPVAIYEPQPGVRVFDLGQNIAGWSRLRVRAEPNREIKLRFAETVFDDGSAWTDEEQTRARQQGALNVTDGSINIANYRSARCTDRYICAGKGQDEVWEPSFTYHGFRFIELTGYPGRPSPETVVGRVVHTDVRSIGRFESSNDLLNWIQKALRWTLVNNLHSVPTDCCQRDERQGWMADAQIACETMLFNFDAASTYIKWLQDMRDNQREDGAIGDTTPYTLGRMGGDIGWGCAILLIAWYVYVFTGDRRVLEIHYPAMKKFLEYLDKTYPARIVDDANYGGDWLNAEETPHPVTNTGYFLLGARIMAQCASILGREKEIRQYAELEGEITRCFQEKLFNRATGQYGNGSQFSNAWPLYLNIVPDELKQSVFGRLVEDIEKRNRHLSTGFLGTRYLLEVLGDYGRADLAYAIVTDEDYPGWGYMRKHQATTLWENWELKTGKGMNSHNHPCFCSVGSWFMKYLAGIRPDPANPGFRHMQIAPVFPEELAFAEGELQTVRGVVRSSWRRKGKEIELQVVIPAGCSAKLQIPAQMKVLGHPLETKGQRTANDFSSEISLASGATLMRIGRG